MSNAERPDGTPFFVEARTEILFDEVDFSPELVCVTLRTDGTLAIETELAIPADAADDEVTSQIVEDIGAICGLLWTGLEDYSDGLITRFDVTMYVPEHDGKATWGIETELLHEHSPDPFDSVEVQTAIDDSLILTDQEP